MSTQCMNKLVCIILKKPINIQTATLLLVSLLPHNSIIFHKVRAKKGYYLHKAAQHVTHKTNLPCLARCSVKRVIFLHKAVWKGTPIWVFYSVLWCLAFLCICRSTQLSTKCPLLLSLQGNWFPIFLLSLDALWWKIFEQRCILLLMLYPRAVNLHTKIIIQTSTYYKTPEN